MNNDNTQQAAPLPSRAELAQRLAAMASVLPGFDNADRDALRQVAELLASAAPSTEAAAAELAAAEVARGVAHAIRPGYTEDRPETWLLCAVHELLKPPKLGLVKVPAFDEMSAWLDEIDRIAAELIDADAPNPPDRGTQPAVMRAALLQMMRLWLVGALHIRAFADLGQFAGDDPDALPIDGNSLRR